MTLTAKWMINQMLAKMLAFLNKTTSTQWLLNIWSENNMGNPSWHEARQLAIYKRGWGVEYGTRRRHTSQCLLRSFCCIHVECAWEDWGEKEIEGAWCTTRPPFYLTVALAKATIEGKNKKQKTKEKMHRKFGKQFQLRLNACLLINSKENINCFPWQRDINTVNTRISYFIYTSC